MAGFARRETARSMSAPTTCEATTRTSTGSSTGAGGSSGATCCAETWTVPSRVRTCRSCCTCRRSSASCGSCGGSVATTRPSSGTACWCRRPRRSRRIRCSGTSTTNLRPGSWNDTGSRRSPGRIWLPQSAGTAFTPVDRLTAFTLLVGVLDFVLPLFEFTFRSDVITQGFDDALLFDSVTEVTPTTQRYSVRTTSGRQLSRPTTSWSPPPPTCLPGCSTWVP